MRTTVTLDDDVVAGLEALRQEQSLGLSEALNRLARAGLVMSAKPRVPFVQRTSPLGLKVDVRNVGEVLELLDELESRDETDLGVGSS